jgi:hypothetical protein
MELNLPYLKKFDLRTKKENAGIPYSIFTMIFIAPTTNSKTLENKYILNVSVKHAGWTRFSQKPSISVPLNIILPSDQSVFGFQEPAGFTPIHLG